MAGAIKGLAGAALLLTGPGGRSLGAASLPNTWQPRGVTRPNILILLTDQERHSRHWPEGWAETNLPNHARLAANGLTFRRAYCNAAMCSPSRATLLSGHYPTWHGVMRTLTYGGSASAAETPLALDYPQTLGHVLATAGYRVVYKGKLHVTKTTTGGEPGAAEAAQLGFHDWEPTTVCENQDMANFAGGCADWDRQIADQAISFLGGQTSQTTAEQPFALVVGLGNPHDVLAYPRTWDAEDLVTGCDNYAGFDFDRGIALPATAGEDLATKPTCQNQALSLYALGLGTLTQQTQKQRYVNFYAGLVQQVDTQIGRILDAIAPEVLANTLIVLTSDHGEMGLAHGGQRQKMFMAYEEAINIPLILSHPQMFPAPRSTDACASLVDLVPTLATLAGVPDRDRWQFSGVDLTPILAEQVASVQDELLFLFDDDNAGQADGLPLNPMTGKPMVTQPNHIRCLMRRDGEGEWKYARYFDPAGIEPDQHELYQLRSAAGEPVDLDERFNLATDPAYAAKAAELAQRLAVLERERLGHPVYLPLIA